MIIGTANGLEKFDKCPVPTPYLISSGPDCQIRHVRCENNNWVLLLMTLKPGRSTLSICQSKLKEVFSIIKVTGKFLRRESLIDL